MAEQGELPPLTEPMLRKLRLLTISSIATEDRIIKYAKLQEALKIDNVRDLEDLIINGTYSNVIQGKLDQRAAHFEVDFAMARDIKRVIKYVTS